jgi:hypothetical protein
MKWVKLMLLAILVLIQTACPKYATKQSEAVRSNTSEEKSGNG